MDLSMIADALGALSFLTIFGGGREPTPASKYWFFLAGGLVALASWLTWNVTYHPGLHLVSAGLAVATIAVFTGAIHLDGLADAADGLLAHLPTEKRFQVMVAPEVGTFGIVSLILALLLQVVAFAEMRPNLGLLVGIFALSRIGAAISMDIFPYAKRGGLVSSFKGQSKSSARAMLLLFLEALGASLLILLSEGLLGVLILVVIGLGQILVLFRSRALLGGYTGDVLGASIVLTETAALVVGALSNR